MGGETDYTQVVNFLLPETLNGIFRCPSSHHKSCQESVCLGTFVSMGPAVPAAGKYKGHSRSEGTRPKLFVRSQHSSNTWLAHLLIQGFPTLPYLMSLYVTVSVYGPL